MTALRWLSLAMISGLTAGASGAALAVSNISPGSSSMSSSSSSAIPVAASDSMSPQDNSQSQNQAQAQSGAPSLAIQITQLRGAVGALAQQQSEQQNEMSLLQQRVLQLEAQDELLKSKLHTDSSSLPQFQTTQSPAPVSPQASTSEGASTAQSGSPQAPSSNSGSESAVNSADLYAKADDLINQGEYKKAERALNSYLLAYPKGENAADAHYWLGEINMVNAQSDVAAKEFRVVLENFPNSPRAPSAMRELGEIFLANGDSQHAKQTLKMVIKKYPDTGAAVLAQKTLDTM